MGKKYVIKDALAVCLKGTKECKLKPAASRFVYTGNKKELANISDVQPYHLEGDFGVCRRQETIGSSGLHQDIRHTQQLAVLGEGEARCQYCPAFPWQERKEDVLIGKEEYPALLEESWTICTHGFGVVVLVTNGQEEDKAALLLEKLDQLEKVVDQYCRREGLDEKKKEELINSVALYQGYAREAIAWEVTSSKESREFCAWLQEEEASLYGFFERGLYLEDCSGETIDLTYMLGLNEAKKQGVGLGRMANREFVVDRGMHNAYMEMYRLEGEKTTSQLIRGMVELASTPEEDPQARYKAYLNSPTEEQRMYYYIGEVKPEGPNALEQMNQEILETSLADSMARNIPEEEGDLFAREQEGKEKAEEYMRMIRSDMMGGSEDEGRRKEFTDNRGDLFWRAHTSGVDPAVR